MSVTADPALQVTRSYDMSETECFEITPVAVPAGGIANLTVNITTKYGAKYSKTYPIEVRAVPEDYDATFTGLSPDGYLDVQVNTPSPTPAFTLPAGDTALNNGLRNPETLTVSGNATLYSANRFVEPTAENDYQWMFTETGVYPLVVEMDYQNIRLTKTLLVRVSDDGVTPTANFDTYFSYYGVVAADKLFYEPALARKVMLADITIANGAPFGYGQLEYQLSTSKADANGQPVEGEPSAILALEEQDYPAGKRRLTVLPNAKGEPGTTLFTLTATIKDEQGNVTATYIKQDSVTLLAPPDDLPIALTLSTDKISISEAQASANKKLQMPALVIPQGKRFPTDSNGDIVDVSATIMRNGQYYDEYMMDCPELLIGDPVYMSFGDSFSNDMTEPGVYRDYYQIDYGNLQWKLPYTINWRVEANDLGCFFDVYFATQVLYYDASATSPVQENLGILSCAALPDGYEGWGAEQQSGPGMTLRCDRNDWGNGIDLQLYGAVAEPADGNVEILLWVQVNNKRYERVISFPVRALPEGMPTGLVTAQDEITVPVNTWANTPDGSLWPISSAEALGSLDTYWMDIYCNSEYYVEGSRYSNSPVENVEPSHPVAPGRMDTIRFRFTKPGHYQLEYTFSAGQNIYLTKTVRVHVTDESGTVPVTNIKLTKDIFADEVAILPDGYYRTQILNLYASSIELLPTDKAVWTLDVLEGQDLAQLYLYQFPGSSYPEVAVEALFAHKPGTIRFKVTMDVEGMYHAESEEFSVRLVENTQKDYDWYLDGQTEYIADEMGNVHIDALEVKGTKPPASYTRDFGYAKPSNMADDGVSINFYSGHETSAEGYDVRLDPNRPGIYEFYYSLYPANDGAHMNIDKYIRVRVLDKNDPEAVFAPNVNQQFQSPMQISDGDGLNTTGLNWNINANEGDQAKWTLSTVSETPHVELYLEGEGATDIVYGTSIVTIANSTGSTYVIANVGRYIDEGDTEFSLHCKQTTASGLVLETDIPFTVTTTADAANLPVITLPVASVTAKAGEILKLPTPTIDWNGLVADDYYIDVETYDMDLYTSYHTELDETGNVVTNGYFYTEAPGRYTISYTIRDGSKRIAYDDLYIVVSNGSTPPANKASLAILSDPNDDDSLDTSLQKDSYWRDVGTVALLGYTPAEGKSVELSVEKPATSNIELLTVRHNSTRLMIVARCPDEQTPQLFKVIANERDDLTGTVKQLDSMSFTLSTQFVPATSVTITGPTAGIGGAELQLTATVAPAGAPPAVTWTTSNATNATVDENGLVTLGSVTAKTTVTITATVVSDTKLKDTHVITITPAAASVAITGADAMLGNGSVKLTAKITPATAAQAVEWSSANTAVATVSADGTVTSAANPDAITTVTIRATATDGSGAYGEREITITPVAKTVTITGEAEVLGGQSTRYGAEVTPADASNSVTWSTDDTAIATIDADGDLTAADVDGQQQVTVTATSTENPGVSGTKTVTIHARVKEVAITGAVDTLPALATLQLSATASPEGAHNKSILWTSSDDAVATVSANGLVTAQNVAGARQVTITATAADAGKVFDECIIRVVPLASSVTVGGDTTMLGNETVQLAATVAPADAKQDVTWSSSDTAVATVDEDGLVTAVNLDTVQPVTITATTTDGSAKQGSIIITVTPVAKAVSVTGGTAQLVANQSFKLGVEVLPAVASSDVIWTTSDATAATVTTPDDEGYTLVTARDVSEPKPVTITATSAQNPAAYGTKLVTIVPRAKTITVSGERNVLGNGSTQLSASVSPTNAAQTVAWSSSDELLVTVNEDGLATVVANPDEVSTVTITATSTDGAGASGSIDLTVTPVATSVTITGDSEVLSLGSIQLNAATQPEAAANSVTWSSSNTNIATVDANGLVTAGDVEKEETADITATSVQNPEVSDVITITVKPRVKSVAIDGQDTVLAGRDVQLSASIGSREANVGEVAWYSGNEGYATVDQTGLVTAKALTVEREVVISAVATDGSEAKAEFTLSIKLPVTGIRLERIGSLRSGDTCIATAIATPDNASNKAILWSASDSTVLDVNEQTGVVAALDVTGKTLEESTVTLIATAADGSGVIAEETIIVTPKVASITVASQSDVETVNLSETNTLQLAATVLPERAEQTVVWSSSDESVAVVSQTGLVTAKKSGSATITATALNDMTDGAKVSGGKQITFTIESGKLPVVPLSVGLARGVELSAITDEGDTFTFESGDTSIATVDEAGMVTGVAEGTTDITVRKTAAMDEWTAPVTVSAAPTSVTLDAEQITLYPGDGYLLKATANSKPTAFSFASSNGAVASVTPVEGAPDTVMVTAVGYGTATVTAASHVQGVSAQATITVSGALDRVELSGPASVIAGQKATIVPTFTPSDAQNKLLTWQSSNSAYAPVTNGLVTVRANAPYIEGGVTVTAHSDMQGVQDATFTFDIVPRVTGVTVHAVAMNGDMPVPDALIELGADRILDFSKLQQVRLSADCAPLHSKRDVTWKSSSAAIATVDQDGLATFLKPGAATFTATATDGSGVKGTVKLTARHMVNSLTVTDPSGNTAGEIVGGVRKTLKLAATVAPINATTQSVTWRCEPAGVVTVNKSGLVSASLAVTESRDVRIIATAGDGSGTAGSYLLTVRPKVATISLDKLQATYKLNEITEIDLENLATIEPEDALKTVTWKSSATGVIRVADGKLQLLKPGTAKLTATTADGSGKSVSKTIVIACVPTDIQLSGPSGVAAGKTAQFTATVYPVTAQNRKVKWSFADGSVSNEFASISASGKLSIKTTETGVTLTVMATADGDKTLNKKQTITVTPLASKVEITTKDSRSLNTLVLDMNVPALASVDLNAVVTATLGTPSQEVKWTTSSAAYATVSADGVVTAVKPTTGKTKVTIAATAMDGSGKSAKLSLTITCLPETVAVKGADYAIATKSITLGVDITPAVAANKNVTWSFADGSLTNEYATINATTGKLTAKRVALAEDDEDGPVTVNVLATSVAEPNVKSQPYPVKIYPIVVKNSLSVVDSGAPGTTASGIDLASGTTLTLSAQSTVKGSLKRFTWKSSNAGVADVSWNPDGSDTCTVTAKKVGSVTITATAADGSKVSAKRTVTIGIMTSGLTIQSSTGANSVVSKKTLKLTAEATPINATNKAVKWVSENESIAKVSKAGVVTAKTVSQATDVVIRAEAQDGSGVKATFKVSVLPLATSVSIRTNADKETAIATKTGVRIHINDGATLALYARAFPYSDNGASQQVTWSTKSAAIATVDQNGVITAHKQGNTTVTAKATDGSGKSATINVYVTCDPTDVQIGGSSQLALGKRVTLTAGILPEGAGEKRVTWTSSDKSVASVSAKGVVTSVNKKENLGKTVTITATSRFLPTNERLTDTWELTITEPVTNVIISTPNGQTTSAKSATETLYLYGADSVEMLLGATCTPLEGASNLVWASSNKAIATVDEYGLVTGLKAGTTSITVTAGDGSGKKATVKVIVK